MTRNTMSVVFALLMPAAEQTFAQATTMPLVVVQGFPLRVVVTEKVRYKLNEPVKAKLVESVFSFDREIIPSGTEVAGHVTGFQRPPKWQRVFALLNGNFTPLREPQIAFDALVFKDGRQLPIQTAVKPGTDRLVQFGGSENQKKKGRVATAKAAALEQINARKQEVLIAVKSPDKMDRLKNLLWGLAPYHPQYVPAGQRFKASLLASLDFGSADIAANDLNQIGGALPPDSVASARLLTDLSSDTTKRGAAVEAVLTRPLLTAERRLAFPEGAMLRGAVVQAKPARRWHRSGQLSFTFTKMEPPSSLGSNAAPAEAIEGRLDSVEVNGASMGNVQFDDEGGVGATQSRKRFIAPAIAVLLASHAGDDGEHAHYMRDGRFDPAELHNNYGARVGTGGFGFGLVGAALGRVSRPFAVVVGFYGAGRSVYSNVVSRGPEIAFPADTPIEIRLGR